MAFKTMDERLDAMVASAAKLDYDQCGCCSSLAGEVSHDVEWLVAEVRQERASVTLHRQIIEVLCRRYGVAPHRLDEIIGYAKAELASSL